MKIAIVEWEDAYIDTVDISPEEAANLKPLIRKTAGFLVEYNENVAVLCTDHYKSDGDWIHAPMVIPKGMIKKIKTFDA
jgi:hypothetical protein